MPDTPPPVPPKKKRRWWIRLLRGAMWTVLALIILHRPLILWGGPIIGRTLAKKQHIDVRFALSGSIFTNLTVTGVRIVPTGTGETPVESIDIEKLRFDYSLLRLAKRGIGEFLSSYEVHHADLKLIALPSPTQKAKEEKKSVAETLQTVLAQPAGYADRVLIDDVNIRVKSADSETVVAGLNLLLDPVQVGEFRMAKLQIPGLPVWENLRAETTYANRNLIQRGLKLTPDIVIDELSFDASHRAEGRGALGVKAHIYGGTFAFALTGEETGEAGKHLEKSYATRFVVEIDGVHVREAAAYFGVKNVPLDRLEHYSLDLTGDPEKPRTWKGNTRVQVNDFASGNLKINSVGATAEFADGKSKIDANVRIGENTARLGGDVALPADIADWAGADADLTLNVQGKDLPAFAEKAGGTVTANATIHTRARTANVTFQMEGRDLTFDQMQATNVALQVEAAAPIPTDAAFTISKATAKVSLDAKAMRAAGFTVDAAKLAASLNSGELVVPEFSVIRGTNTINVSARTKLPEDLGKIAQSAGTAKIAVHVPALGEFGVVVAGKPLGGRIDLNADATFGNETIEGDARLAGGAFSLGEFTSGDLSADISAHGGKAELKSFSFDIAPNDRITASAQIATAAPQAYEGTLALGLTDFAALKPLLDVFGVKEAVQGKLHVTWNGTGSLQPGKHTGALEVDVGKTSYGKWVLDEAKIGTRYTEASAEATLRLVAGPTDFRTQVAWVPEQATIRELELRQGDQLALAGGATYSLVKPEGQQTLDPLRQPFTVNLEVNKLDLNKLVTSLGQPAVASGRIDAALLAKGTAARPEVKFTLEGRSIKAAAAGQLDPAEVDVALDLHPGTLTLDAAVRQPLIQPLSVHANLPLDVEKVLADGKLDPALPLDIAAKMPKTSLAFVPKMVPAVRRLDGNVSLDVHVHGTVEKPELSGSAEVSLQDARMANPSIPSIGKFEAKLGFLRDTLAFERFRGELGGGTFDLTGSVKLQPLDNPAFQLQLKADDVLVKRDDSITVRTDADIKVGGALKAGTLTGEVFVTQSRFFKEIDILPIALPGRPKPAPKSAPSTPDISLPPPLDKWKIDLAIKTRENDAFLVRGNLANGQVSMNLRVGNEGPQPWVEGTVSIDTFTASLPFSSLTVENGKVFFTKNTPIMEPTIDLQAVSKIRDYTVNAYIFGKATEPQIQFTSEPPLPHADIVSLLATGTTTSELTGNADVLASRAALLAVQSLWKKVFKKGSSPPPPPNKNDPNFLDRFEMELGALDQKTGAREATARFKVNDQFQIIGELDTQGRYTGSLKYLLRFR